MNGTVESGTYAVLFVVCIVLILLIVAFARMLAGDRKANESQGGVPLDDCTKRSLPTRTGQALPATKPEKHGSRQLYH
jgi:hypothetical protein